MQFSSEIENSMDFSVMPFEVRAEGDLCITDLAETGIFLFMNIFNVSIDISVVFVLYSTQSAGLRLLHCHLSNNWCLLGNYYVALPSVHANWTEKKIFQNNARIHFLECCAFLHDSLLKLWRKSVHTSSANILQKVSIGQCILLWVVETLKNN